MASLVLRIRTIRDGELLHAEFDSEADALTWLADRPRYTEVLGVATQGLSRESHAALRTAARPLDAEEQALVSVLDQAAEEATRAYEASERQREADEAAAYKEAMRTADPLRPMTVEWTAEGGMRLVDRVDPREITDLAREAVLAWVRDREGWVRDRGQTVSEATVTVWPGTLPAGHTERVQPGGHFVAVVVEP